MPEDYAVLSRISSVESRVHDIQIAIPPMVQALAVIGSQVHSIDGQMQVLRSRQDETQKLVSSLYEDFQGYLDDYRRRTELQLAETRIVKVRQEIEQRFGHYDEVRRRVTGILQATDLSIIRQETLRTTSEELMLGAPRYWLTPILVALMGWIVDERDLADRSLVETVKRDPYKASLFLTLVCRRAGRREAMNRWLGLYLQLLDPFAIDREVVVVLDAVATGTLGGPAQELFWQTSLEWIKALRQVPGQVEEQARRWVEVLDAERGRVGLEECKLLRAQSTTWPRLESSLANARRNPRTLERFRRVLTSSTPLPSSITAAIDDLLDTLVGRFDDEELPLRRTERLLQLIIDGEGDREGAERQMAVEQQAFAEKVSFVGRLTDALMHPEQAGATQAAQRFAAAFSRDWILAAHLYLVQRDQREIPEDVEIAVGDWRGTSRGGENNLEVAGSLEQHYAEKTQRALAAIKLPIYAWLVPLIGLFFFLSSPQAGLVALFLGGLLYLLGRWRRGKARAAAATRLAGEREMALRNAQACLGELAGYRRALSAAYDDAAEVEALLKSITPADSVYPGSGEEPAGLLGEGDGAGAAMPQRTGAGFQGAELARQLAAWDLVPVPVSVRGSGPAQNQ